MRECIPQSSPHWVPARIGCLTASRVADAIATTKRGPSERRKKLLFELLAERVTDVAADHYVTPAMQWGIDNEEPAAARYEAETGNFVSDAGLVMHREIPFFGATPDRFVGTEGAIEIKCPATKNNYLAWRNTADIPDEYITQIYAQMACCEWLQWIDFVAYDPRVRLALQIRINRVERDDQKILAIEAAAKAFLAELDEMFDKFTTEAQCQKA